MSIKDIFAKNGDVRNIVFVIALSLGIVMVVTYFLMGHSFLYAAPIILLMTFVGFAFKPTKIYLPFCAGVMLQFGLFAGVMGLLTIGPVPGVYVDFIIGIIGYLMLVTSIWQAVFGEWKLSRLTNIVIQVVSIMGLVFCVFVVVLVEVRGMPQEETPHYRTY